MSTTQSVLTPIRVHTDVIRKVLDVHAEMRAMAEEIATIRGRIARGGGSWHDRRRVIDLENEVVDMETRELEALRAYYMATAGAMGIDVTRPADMAARLESTLRMAAGGGL